MGLTLSFLDMDTLRLSTRKRVAMGHGTSPCSGWIGEAVSLHHLNLCNFRNMTPWHHRLISLVNQNLTFMDHPFTAVFSGGLALPCIFVSFSAAYVLSPALSIYVWTVPWSLLKACTGQIFTVHREFFEPQTFNHWLWTIHPYDKRWSNWGLNTVSHNNTKHHLDLLVNYSLSLSKLASWCCKMLIHRTTFISH